MFPDWQDPNSRIGLFPESGPACDLHAPLPRKRPNDSPEFNKTLGKALLLTTLGQSLRFTHATR